MAAVKPPQKLPVRGLFSDDEDSQVKLFHEVRTKLNFFFLIFFTLFCGEGQYCQVVEMVQSG